MYRPTYYHAESITFMRYAYVQGDGALCRCLLRSLELLRGHFVGNVGTSNTFASLNYPWTSCICWHYRDVTLILTWQDYVTRTNLFKNFTIFLNTGNHSENLRNIREVLGVEHHSCENLKFCSFTNVML
jgi:hypothetical protein